MSYSPSYRGSNSSYRIANSSYRGSGRGGGGSSYRSSNYPKAPPLPDAPPDRNIKGGLNVEKVVENLEIPSATTGGSSKSTEIQNLMYVGSYNWTESARPTIIVPGSPPVWKENLRIPMTLQPDTRVQITNQNGYRVPSSALLPLMMAADTVDKKVDWPSVDFVTNRNGLRKLMRWIDGTASRDFRIDMELAGDQTVLFDRWEAQDREASNGKSFGLNFKDETTTPAPGCEKSSGHHRIVQYEFFDLKLIVRFEVDACLPTDAPKKGAVKTAVPTLDDLADSLAGMQLATAAADKDSKPSSAGAKLASPPSVEVIRAGAEVPQENIVELTTRSVHYINQFNWGDVYPQLYLSKTPHLFIGIHGRGVFSEIRRRNLDAADMAEQRRTAEASLQKLGRALETIQEVVIEHGQGKRLSLVCEGGELKVYERSGAQSLLPKDVMARFESI